MAVTSCTLKREGRSGHFGPNAQRDYQVQWIMTTNSDNDGPAVLKLGGPSVGPHPLPTLGLTYNIGSEADLRAFCHDIRFERNPKRIQEWTATADYKTLQSDVQVEGVQGTPPLSRSTTYRIEHEHWTKVVEKDKDGIAIKNSAGVPFDTGVELDDSYLVLIAEKNFATLQQIIDLNTSFAMKVNNDVFKGGTSRTWLCRPIGCSDIQSEEGVSFYRATFHLVYKPDRWDVEIVDKGFSELNAGQLRDILDKNKQPITEPWPLNGAGVALPAGGTLVFLTKRIRGEVAFSGLGV